MEVDPRQAFADLIDDEVRTMASVRADGSALVAVAPARLLRELDACCAGQGLRLVGTVSALQVIATGGDSPATIVDANSAWTVSAQAGRIASIRFARVAATDACPPPLDLALVQAAAEVGEVVFTRPRESRATFRALAFYVAAAGVGVLLVAPPLASRFRTAGLEHVMSRSEAATREAERGERQRLLEQEREARVLAFEERTLLQARLPLMARLAANIPSDIFVTQMAAESTAVEMTAVGEDVTRLPHELQKHAAIANARIVGAVTRELVNERALQRATIRFEIEDARPSLARPEERR